jgi:hypothetical protein
MDEIINPKAKLIILIIYPLFLLLFPSPTKIALNHDPKME